MVEEELYKCNSLVILRLPCTDTMLFSWVEWAGAGAVPDPVRDPPEAGDLHGCPQPHPVIQGHQRAPPQSSVPYQLTAVIHLSAGH